MKERSNGSTAGYYQLPAGAAQLQDLISQRDMNAQIGEIFRACYRYGLVEHSDMLRDARKILFYAKAEVERLEKLQAESQLNTAEKPNVWIPWKATKDSVCPVECARFVKVRWSDGSEDTWQNFKGIYWDTSSLNGISIVAYKVFQ